MLKKLWLLTVAALLFSCNSLIKEKPTLLKDFAINDYINSYFTAPESFAVHSDVKYGETVRLLYGKNQNRSFWFTADNQPSAQSEQMFGLLTNSMIYGLDTTLYNTQTIRAFRQGLSQDSLITNDNKQAMLGYELCLTQSAMLFFTHLNQGIMPFNLSDYEVKEKNDSNTAYRKIYRYFDEFSSDSLATILQHAFTTDSIAQAVQAIQPQNIHYKKLQKALENYVLGTPINHDSIQTVYFGKDTVWTSTFENYRKGCLALQKLRWSNVTGKQYIFINIPSFTLDLVQENRLACTHKIICGTVENQTPELNSRLKQIRLFPDWNVPYSIATKEILPAVKRNVGYMARHHYEVLDRKGNVLNPDSVPWKRYTEKSFPLRIRQTPGYHNSLGIIMFYFDNMSSVYFHDTPAKGLFGREFRSFSHGCMRLQNPLDFANILLKFDSGILSLPKDDLQEMGIYQTQMQKRDKFDRAKDSTAVQRVFKKRLQEKEKYFYNIKKNIPIYIRYLTAFCREDNTLGFSPDFYRRDAVLITRYDEAVAAIVGKWGN